MSSDNDIWSKMKREAVALSSKEPMLSNFYDKAISQHEFFSTALAFNLANFLSDEHVPFDQLINNIELAYDNNFLPIKALKDIQAYFDRDPACDNYCLPFLFFKGFLAVQSQRLANSFWNNRRESLALYIHHKICLLWDCDIHPGAHLGEGLMVDHATGLVIGETTEIGDNVSILHGVTLGGSGLAEGKRHPTIGNGVMISAGAKILGALLIGDGSKIGAGSVVLNSIPAGVTVAGVPAKIIGRTSDDSPSLTMNQKLN